MKKDVPNLSKINVPNDSDALEGLLLLRFDRIIEEGFIFPCHDFDLYCAILLRKLSLENLPKVYKDYIIQDGTIRQEVQFQMINLAIEKREIVNDEEIEFYFKLNHAMALDRKKIVKDEIGRTGVNSLKVNLTNSSYYRELLQIIKGFTDLTLIDWYIPIVLTFKKFVHIYIKHVEETKFNEGQFKHRSYFDYKHSEILTLLKNILHREEQDIKEHFMKVSFGFNFGDKALVKDYHRGFGKFPPIMLGDDKFRLTINKYGFIESFYQTK